MEVRTIAIIGEGFAGREIAQLCTRASYETILIELKPGLLDEAAGADLVIEVVAEKIHRKIRIFMELDDLCPPHTLFATTTADFRVTEIAAATRRPENCIGMRFSASQIEIIRGTSTSSETCEAIHRVAEKMGLKAAQIRE